jgi:hypothetical protein
LCRSQCFSIVPVFKLINNFQFRFGIRFLGKWSGVVLIIVPIAVLIVVLIVFIVFIVFIFVIPLIVIVVLLLLLLTTRQLRAEIWFIVGLAVVEHVFGFTRVFAAGIVWVAINSTCSRAGATAYDGVFIRTG